ncbi:MAG: hypothetical protein UMR38_04460 [Candidatus Izemoplasma sp.]|nr:hypothetical protein [Candidatus Izemoplasma sp.]
MKKLLAFLVTLALAITLVGCSGTETTTLKEPLSSDEAIATLSYLSAGFMNTGDIDTPTASELTFLSEQETTVVEDELDNINVYVDKLMAFINGADQFGSIIEETSDRAEYEHKMTITVNQDFYVLYYNLDVDSDAITGIFIVDDVEYNIIATNNLEDKDELDDENEEIDNEDKDELDDENEEVDTDDDSEDDEDEEETEKEMTLTATNGTDTITITYKAESDEEEVETEFVIVKNIDGVESAVELQIKQEADEYKIEIVEEGKSYEFKREMEDEGLVYKLEYEVDGVEGEIKITVGENEAGETIYTYEIEEEGKDRKEIEKEDPDDDEEEEEDEDTEETTTA